MEMMLIFFTAQLGKITLTFFSNHPQHQTVSCRYAINRYCLEIDYRCNNDSLTHMQHYLLVDSLLFCFTIILSVIKVCCLQNPHIQAYTFEAFMMCNAANVIFTLLKLVYNSFYFTATYTLMVSRHYFTFSTLAPIQNGSL